MVQTAERSGQEIKRDILNRYYWDSGVNANNINIEVTDGRVTLTGSVPSADDRRRAERDARAAPGVTGVDNQLAVKPTDDVVIASDREVESKIRELIQWYSDIDAAHLAIAVNGGYTTLAGTVSSYYQKFRAQELAKDVIGVRKIDNRIAVVLTNSERDRRLAACVVASLKDALGADADAVTVMVHEGVVTLTGMAADELAFQAAGTVAGRVEGIAEVRNFLSTRGSVGAGQR